jgi:hypothetical protein
VRLPWSTLFLNPHIAWYGKSNGETRIATLIPNEASLLRLASTVLFEISDD